MDDCIIASPEDETELRPGPIMLRSLQGRAIAICASSKFSDRALSDCTLHSAAMPTDIDEFGVQRSVEYATARRVPRLAIG